MAITTNNTRFKLFVNQTDYSDYVVPESIRYRNELARGTIGELQFTFKQMPSGFAAAGGQRVDLYLPLTTTPLFSGQILQNEPVKHSTGAWSYRCVAASWENAFYRKKSYIQFRNLTYAQAVESVLQDSTQNYPNVILTTVTDTDSLLTGAMPFHSFSGQYPAEIFDYIGRLTGSNWRIISGATVNEFKLEFYNPFTYRPSEPLAFTNSTENFFWREFQPLLETGSIINAQTVRGSIVPAITQQIALFRGEGLNSKFPLPLKPYSNLNRIEVFDQFEGSELDSRVWAETDKPDDHVYLDGDGFLQFDISTAPEWVGIESQANIERSNSPTAVWDITWLGHGRAIFALCSTTFNSGTPTSFIEAGFYVDDTGLLHSVFNGGTPTSLGITLSVTTQYRFRCAILPTGGAVLTYQTGADTFTRVWTSLASSVSGATQDLRLSVFSYNANFNVDMVKCTNPYLGIKVETDRGLGFVEEFIGIYPVDEDVDVVLEGEQTISFFGSNPGPSTIPPAPTAKVFTVSDLALDLCSVSVGHGIATGAAVTVSSTGTLPAGLSAATTYYLHQDSYSTFTLYDTLANAQAGGATGRLNITSAGTGTHTLTVTLWATKDSDYKNIRVTYSPGQRLQATFRDSESIAAIAALYGLGDTGVREGDVIIDENLTSYEACLARAQLEVSNKNQILRQVRLGTNFKVLQDAGYALPKIGANARFYVLLDATNYTIEADLPIVSMQVTARNGANDWEVQLVGSYIERGLRQVIETLRNSLFISISDNELGYESSFSADTATLSDSATGTAQVPMTYWGDSRRAYTISSVDTTNDRLTLGTHNFSTGDTIRVTTTGVVPTGLAVNTIYFVNAYSGTVIVLYDTLVNAQAGGATGRVDVSSSGSGTNRVIATGGRWNRMKWLA